MTDTTADDRQHVADLASRAEVTSTVARVAGDLGSAVTGSPGNDPIRNDTVEL